MARLVFNGAEVRKLFEHAQASKEHSPTFGMMMDPKCHKEGVKLPKDGEPNSDQIDYGKVPAHLKLVKDDGVYLMSSGIPGLKGVEAHNHVVYAKGFGRDADWDTVRAAMGGDDFSEGLELPFWQPAMDGDATEIVLNVTARRISMSYTPGPNAKKQERRELPQYDKQVLNRVHREAKATWRPAWYGRGRAYKGAVLEVDGAVLYQLVRGQVVLLEVALLPQPLTRKGEEVEYVYDGDISAPATIKEPAKRRKAASKG
jgi:hypothetical protein